MRQPLSVCHNAGWHLLEAVWLACSEQTFLPQHFQHSFFWSQHCCFFLGPISTFHLPHGNIMLAFGQCPNICENVGRAACSLWSRGSWLGGALVSALCLCCFLAHRLLYGIVCLLLFSFAIPILRWYNVITSSGTFQMPVNWPADHHGFWCVFGVFLCVLFGVWFLLFAFFVLHGDSSMDYDPIQFSFVCTLSSWLMLPPH